MMAVLLAGGKGTRLKPLTLTIPKPLLPLGDISILEVVLSQFAAARITRVVITVGHMANLLMASIGKGDRFGLQIEYCIEDKPLGTAGCLRLIDNLEECFLVMNGDLLTTLNYQELMEAHRRGKAAATIAVHKREVHVDYGVIEMSPDGAFNRYIEKPIIPYYVSMGINVLSRTSVDIIPPHQKFDMPQLMTELHRANLNVLCHKTDCYWQDIGRFDDYQQASEDFTRDPSRFLPHGMARK